MHCNFSKKIENDPTDDIIKFKQKEITEKIMVMILSYGNLFS